MLRATAIVRKAAIRPDSVADSVTLDHDGRQGAAAILNGAGGLSFTLALSKPAPVEDGDAFRLEDGRLVRVRAAAEPLLEVRAENPARLMRLSWQLGGSHVPGGDRRRRALYSRDSGECGTRPWPGLRREPGLTGLQARTRGPRP